MIRTVDILRKKRDGLALSREEIDTFIEGVADGSVPDYQISAFTMAVFFQNMTEEELYHMTMAMVRYGDQLDLSQIRSMPVDKHSTGGVGDKVSLVLGPLVASAGVPVSKMSGRSLGHTGGTIDKLESIPGFDCELSKEAFVRQLNEIGVGIIAQSGNLAPADKRMYAIRDVTATVENTALIAASVVSKKLASGNRNIVFDVKVGRGAFMKTEPRALDLARTMVDLVERAGGRAVAVISRMDEPLGREVGNANEVREAIATLNNAGPSDLTGLCLSLGSQMLVMTGAADSEQQGQALLQEKLENGQALEKFRQMVAAQGGDPRVADDPGLLPQPVHSLDVTSDRTGWVNGLDAMRVGQASGILGAGRRRKEDPVDHSAGITVHKKCGDQVASGDVLCSLFWSGDDVDAQEAADVVREAYTIQETVPQARPVVLRVVTGSAAAQTGEQTT